MPYSLFVGLLRAQNRAKAMEQKQAFLLSLHANNPSKKTVDSILKGFDDGERS